MWPKSSFQAIHCAIILIKHTLLTVVPQNIQKIKLLLVKKQISTFARTWKLSENVTRVVSFQSYIFQVSFQKLV